MSEEKEIRVIDCLENIHYIKVNNVKDILYDQPPRQSKPITTIELKEVSNGLSAIRTYENPVKLRDRVRALK